MSWFARSIANTFQLDDDDDDAKQRSLNNNNNNNDASTDQKPEQDDDSPLSPGRGVKEDLSEITKTLTSKLWGVASFLAPPPADEHSSQQSDPSDPKNDAPEGMFGIRRDFAEIGGRFRSGISKLSSNIDVSEITKLASNILQLTPDGEDRVLAGDVEAIGVTDEVLAFVRDVTMHPETWMDFPLSDDEDDSEDFELSDVQQEHALAVESLVPRLAALRLELCPGYMSERAFWKIYFVLLHPRLEPNAAELLSTPEIVKARASLAHELKGHSNSQTHEKQFETVQIASGTQFETVPLEASATPLTTPARSADTEKTENENPVQPEEVQVVDKAVIKEEPQMVVASKTSSNLVEDKDEDDWLKEDDGVGNVEVSGTATTTIPIENDEDVTFSDFEDEDDEDAGQVIEGKSGMKESNDWLDVDDIDVA